MACHQILSTYNFIKTQKVRHGWYNIKEYDPTISLKHKK